jgi:sulfite reductase beta subunit-like hemoprotein
LDLDTGKRLGALLGAAHTCDVVDAHVASLARPGDRVLTSDPDDLRRLVDTLGVEAVVVSV